MSAASQDEIRGSIGRTAETELARERYRPHHLHVTLVEDKGDDWWYVVVQPTEPVARDRDYYAALHEVEDAVERARPELRILVVPVLPAEE